MISEGSCDTEHPENSALPPEEKLKLDKSYLNCNTISQYYYIFDQINPALESLRDFFQRKKRLTDD